MEAGTIVRWLKSEGEQVQKGEPLYELDTDKVTQEVEADASGVLLQIAVAEGEVPVGQTIAVIGEEGEQVSAPEAAAEKVDEEPQEEGSRAPERDEERERGQEASSNGSDQPRRSRRRSPRETTRAGQGLAAGAQDRARARDRPRVAARHRAGGADRGRGRRARGHRAAAVTAVADRTGEIERVPLTSLRKTIARRMTEAWQAPAFQISMSADMTRAVELRAAAARARRRRRAAELQRHPDQGLRGRADAAPRRQRALCRTTRSSSCRARTSASPSPSRTG